MLPTCTPILKPLIQAVSTFDIKIPTLVDVQDDNSDSEELDDGEYRVEYIREHRYHRPNGPQYLIRWQGFTEADDSWEPAENFTEPSLLQTYWELQAPRNRKYFEVSRASSPKPGKSLTGFEHVESYPAFAARFASLL